MTIKLTGGPLNGKEVIVKELPKSEFIAVPKKIGGNYEMYEYKKVSVNEYKFYVNSRKL